MTLEYIVKEAKEEGLEQGRTEGIAEGKAEGLAEGEKIGEARGEASKAREMAKALKDKGVAIDIIAETSGLSKEEIEKL